MKKKYILVLLFIISLIFFTFETQRAFVTVSAHASFLEKKPKIIIDAGHGGEDGGAIGVNGVLEKDLNLSISLKLKEYFESNNFEVITIRDGDYAVGDLSLSTIRKRKVSDAQERLKQIAETGECIYISIHQNSFTEDKYSGADTFYSPNREESKILAECIKKSIVSSLQPENTREIKEAGENIFLMYNCKVPAVLVECGFISNPVECEKLCTDEYQVKIAKCIYNGVIDYITSLSH